MASKDKSLGSVLVIGGCGFLGHHLVNLLLRDWTAKVSVIDLKCERNRRPDRDGVSYHEADITDTEKLTALFKELKPDVVIHTASPTAQAAGPSSNALFKKVNVDGTRSVVEASNASGVKALVYTSSASIISNNKDDLINADERWPVIRGKEQSEYYSETKAEAEELVLAANRQSLSNLLTCSIRPAGIMGEGDVQTVYHMLNLYREGRHNIQVGENTNLFDFTYVENVAHGHLLAARALLVTAAQKTEPLDYEKVDGEAFFITNDSPIYFWDMPRAIWAHAGNPHGTEKVWTLGKDLGLFLGLMSELVFTILRKPPTLNRQRIIFSCMTRYYDITKAKRRLGYTPLVPLEEGIKRAVDWSLEQEKEKAAKKTR